MGTLLILSVLIQIQFHVVADGNGKIANQEWLDTQVAAANRHFAPLEVGFEIAGIDELPASAIHLETRADRNALAHGRLKGKLIHVFIVGQLDDVDTEGAIAYGVTWRLPKDSRRYIIISVQAL